MSIRNIKIHGVTSIKLEPKWSEGDHLDYLSLTLIDKAELEFQVVAFPVYGQKMDLLFPDPPAGLDGLAGSGFIDVTNGEPGSLAFVRDEFITKQAQQLEDFMREQADILGTAEGLPFDFDEELGEVMEALQEAIAVRLHLALNQTELDLCCSVN